MIPFTSALLYLMSNFFFFKDPATTEIYTLSLHDALPILIFCIERGIAQELEDVSVKLVGSGNVDRKSTRLNSSHVAISYAVFCLKKKKKQHSTSSPNTLVSPTYLTDSSCALTTKESASCP